MFLHRSRVRYLDRLAIIAYGLMLAAFFGYWALHKLYPAELPLYEITEGPGRYGVLLVVFILPWVETVTCQFVPFELARFRPARLKRGLKTRGGKIIAVLVVLTTAGAALMAALAAAAQLRAYIGFLSIIVFAGFVLPRTLKHVPLWSTKRKLSNWRKGTGFVTSWAIFAAAHFGWSMEVTSTWNGVTFRMRLSSKTAEFS